MSELKPFSQPPLPGVEANPAACRCHVDAPAGELQETDDCRCHLTSAGPLASPAIATPFPGEEARRFPDRVSMSRGSVGPVKSLPVSRLRAILSVVFLVPVLALGVGLLVSGFQPAVVAGLVLFLPAVLPLALVGLGILFTRDLHARWDEQEAGYRSGARRETPSLASSIR